MKIRLVIFDFDGTMADTRQNIVRVMQQTMRTLDLPVADDDTCASTIGLPLKACFHVIYPQLSDEEGERCAETYRRIFFANAKGWVPNLFPNVLETIQTLYSHGVMMAIASSRNSTSLRGFLQEMNLTEVVRMVVGADEVKAHKPDPEPVNVILSALKIPADECVVVGDMPVDIMMGNAAGAHTCAVTFGNASREELVACGTNYLIDDMSQLLSIVLPDYQPPKSS
ncbi:MAG: HAD family hydrolase [Bacteroidales bacterium]|nr:HAD family hydrolase [Bacteroidales bacterium]